MIENSRYRSRHTQEHNVGKKASLSSCGRTRWVSGAPGSVSTVDIKLTTIRGHVDLKHVNECGICWHHRLKVNNHSRPCRSKASTLVMMQRWDNAGSRPCASSGRVSIRRGPDLFSHQTNSPKLNSSLLPTPSYHRLPTTTFQPSNMRFQVLVAGFLTMTASGVVAAPVLKVSDHDIEHSIVDSF
jgi:hypothetical protein